jgi:hypothetical protein
MKVKQHPGFVGAGFADEFEIFQCSISQTRPLRTVRLSKIGRY